MAEIKLMSCVTLKDLIGLFDIVDYIESDISNPRFWCSFPTSTYCASESAAFKSARTEGRPSGAPRPVRKQWRQIVFRFEPNGAYDGRSGKFVTNDGTLIVKNPDL